MHGLKVTNNNTRYILQTEVFKTNVNMRVKIRKYRQKRCLNFARFETEHYVKWFVNKEQRKEQFVLQA
jgi:hypothetical protein